MRQLRRQWFFHYPHHPALSATWDTAAAYLLQSHRSRGVVHQLNQTREHQAVVAHEVIRKSLDQIPVLLAVDAHHASVAYLIDVRAALQRPIDVVLDALLLTSTPSQVQVVVGAINESHLKKWVNQTMTINLMEVVRLRHLLYLNAVALAQLNHAN